MIWSWALAVIGICGIWLIGNGRQSGYVVGVFAQVAWFVYALATSQFGFIVTCVAYGYVYARGWMKARHRESV